jgi:hypothetical protein
LQRFERCACICSLPQAQFCFGSDPKHTSFACTRNLYGKACGSEKSELWRGSFLLFSSLRDPYFWCFTFMAATAKPTSMTILFVVLNCELLLPCDRTGVGLMVSLLFSCKSRTADCAVRRCRRCYRRPRKFKTIHSAHASARRTL